MSDQMPVIIDQASGEVEDAPLPRGQRYRCKLDNLQDVRREMAKIYRECRSDVIDPGVGSKLTFMLKEIARVITDSDLEARVAALEGKQ